MSAPQLIMVVAVTCVTRDGRMFMPGDTLKLPAADVERLLAGGAVRAHDGEPALKVVEGGAPGADATRVSLEEAIANLVERAADGTVSREAAYTASGKPDCRMLGEIVGRDVAAAERDAAWDAWRASLEGAADGGGKE